MKRCLLIRIHLWIVQKLIVPDNRIGFYHSNNGTIRIPSRRSPTESPENESDRSQWQLDTQLILVPNPITFPQQRRNSWRSGRKTNRRRSHTMKAPEILRCGSACSIRLIEAEWPNCSILVRINYGHGREQRMDVTRRTDFHWPSRCAVRFRAGYQYFVTTTNSQLPDSP